jgi:hypothetical protein
MIGKTTTMAEARVRASRTVQAKVRMPATLHRKLMRDADRSGQTLNAEILRRLEKSYEGDEVLRGVSDKLSVLDAGLSRQSEQFEKIASTYLKLASETFRRQMDEMIEKAKKP